MARRNLLKEVEKEVKPTLKTLNESIEEYGDVKVDEKKIKDKVSALNTQIKDWMKKLVKPDEDGKYSADTGEWVASLTITDKSTMNEEKLIAWLKKNDLGKGIIKRKEYVDEDALTKAVYNGTITEKQLVDMEVCKDVSTVETLRVTKKKKEKKDGD